MFQQTSVPCGHCGMHHTGACPRIKAIEYYENGTVKRVEYHAPVKNTVWKIGKPSDD